MARGRRADRFKNGNEKKFVLAVAKGCECMLQYMKERVARIGIEDTVKLLTEDQPRFDSLSEDLRQQLDKLGRKGCACARVLFPLGAGFV